MGPSFNVGGQNWAAVKIDGAQINGHFALSIRNSVQEIIHADVENAARNAVWPLCDKTRAVRFVNTAAEILHTAKCITWEGEIFCSAIAGAISFEGRPATCSSVEGMQFHILKHPLTVKGDACTLLDLEPNSTCMAIIALQVTGIDGRKLTQDERSTMPGVVPGGTILDASSLSGRRGIVFMEIWYPEEMATFPRLRIWPTLWEGDAIPFAYAERMAMLEFLKLPFVQQERSGISRQVRRQYERKGAGCADVRTITLRRVFEETSSPKEATTREWSCQWMVRGHWRKRAERYGPGEPIYVNPYAKGPDGKPFKTNKETVFMVKR
jgi:hypothetical protein